MIELIKGINTVSNSEYHSDKTHISSSSLKKLLTDREQFHKEHVLGERKPLTGNFLDEGSYVHSLILEPEKVEEEYAISQSFHKRGKEWTEFYDANMNSGKILLSKAQSQRCKTYYDAYKRNKNAVDLVSEGEAEHTVCGELNGVKVKVRADWVNVDKGYIVDVKTSAHSVDKDSFKLTIDRYMYQLSASLYCKVLEQEYGKPFDFYYIAISKSELNCEVFKTSKMTMQEGDHMVSKALSIYKKCIETNTWKNPKKRLDESIISGDIEEI